MQNQPSRTTWCPIYMIQMQVISFNPCPKSTLSSKVGWGEKQHAVVLLLVFFLFLFFLKSNEIVGLPFEKRLFEVLSSTLTSGGRWRQHRKGWGDGNVKRWCVQHPSKAEIGHQRFPRGVVLLSRPSKMRSGQWREEGKTFFLICGLPY